MNEKSNPQQTSAPPIFVVSGSLKGVGEQLVDTILAQFPGAHVPVEITSLVREVEQIDQIVSKAAAAGGIIVHTMVDPEIRQALLERASAKNVFTIDLAGPLMDRLTGLLDQEPVGKPGLYRELHETQFTRIEAIEFTLAHDDGTRFQEWDQAEIILVGVSRVYKTPLSLYLAMLGWKVANVPLVMGVPLRKELFGLDRRRIVGLTIDPDQLLHHRQHRQRHLGVQGMSTYVDPLKLYEELESARKLFRRSGFAVVDVTDKPIETSADEVLAVVSRRLRTEPMW